MNFIEVGLLLLATAACISCVVLFARVKDLQSQLKNLDRRMEYWSGEQTSIEKDVYQIRNTVKDLADRLGYEYRRVDVKDLYGWQKKDQS